MAAQDHCFLLTQGMNKPHYRRVVANFSFPDGLVPSQ
jgi:hypothetical protein